MITTKLNNVLVTGRCISLKYIDDEWVDRAKKFADSVVDSHYNSDNDVAGIFWLSLTDFYCCCGQVFILSNDFWVKL